MFMDKVIMTQQGVFESSGLGQKCAVSMQKGNIRFNGGLINGSMIKAMGTLRSLFFIKPSKKSNKQKTAT